MKAERSKAAILADATIADSFESLANKLGELLESSLSISELIKLAVGAWVDSVVARPNLARLIMRS